MKRKDEKRKSNFFLQVIYVKGKVLDSTLVHVSNTKKGSQKTGLKKGSETKRPTKSMLEKESPM